MSRGLVVLGVLAALTCAAGCRCFPGFGCYADFMDDVGDDEWAFDQWYNPRLDISRAGRPDWCSPLNRKLGGCQCCGKPYWSWADCCWLYPARHPHYYPSQVVPPPGMVMTSPAPAAAPAATPYQTPMLPSAPPPAPMPNPYEEPPPAAKPAPPLPAPPFPDPQAYRPPSIVAEPVFELPLQ